MIDISTSSETRHPDVGAAFTELWAPVLRLAHVVCGDAQLAEDLAQDAFIGLSRHWDTVTNPMAYLRRSVVNLSINAGTRSRRERDHRCDVPVLLDEPILDETWNVLATLPARQRAALVLRFYEDLGEAEIARLLECRRGTVKSLIHRGLAQIRPLLEADR